MIVIIDLTQFFIKQYKFLLIISTIYSIIFRNCIKHSINMANFFLNDTFSKAIKIMMISLNIYFVHYDDVFH